MVCPRSSCLRMEHGESGTSVSGSNLPRRPLTGVPALTAGAAKGGQKPGWKPNSSKVAHVQRIWCLTALLCAAVPVTGCCAPSAAQGIGWHLPERFFSSGYRGLWCPEGEGWTERTALPHKLYQPLLPLQPLRGSTLGFWGAGDLRLHTLEPLRKHTRGPFGASRPASLWGTLLVPPPQGPSSHPGNIAVLTLPTEWGPGPTWPTSMAPRASPRGRSHTGQTPATCLGHRFDSPLSGLL